MFPYSIDITEDVGIFNLQVQRDGGAFGEVGVLYLISSISTDNEDFAAVTSGVLHAATH